jgi:hypothetical protein
MNLSSFGKDALPQMAVGNIRYTVSGSVIRWHGGGWITVSGRTAKGCGGVKMRL